MTMMAQPMPSPRLPIDPGPGAAGGRLVATDGRTLPLRATSIETTASGGVGRVTLKQRFVNSYDEPLTVRYQVPLPADGAVSGFAFQLGDKRIEGEVDTKKNARTRYETALVEGRSAAILAQDRSSLFTQEVGNIPPAGEITAEIQIDQKLRWLPEGCWEWRFPTVVAPRFSGSPSRVADATKIAVPIADDELDVRVALSMSIEDVLQGQPESPSHGIIAAESHGAMQITLRGGEARLDRDVVVRWPVATETTTTALSVARPTEDHACAQDSFGLLTIVPPRGATSVDPSGEVSRDLILLIDTSGSMHGEPLSQARRVCLALVDSLSDEDQLEMIEFSWRPTQWKRKSVAATAKNKKSARKWLTALEANGGTEMREGIMSALKPMRSSAQRQIVIISDGLIGFETEIVREIATRLPAGSRVHCVGVGSSVNRSLTGPAARAGRGIEAIIGIGEDAERAAARLVAHTAAPVVVDLHVSGGALRGHAPRRLPDLMAGAPALIALQLDPAGGEIIVRGTTADGTWEQRVTVPGASKTGEGHPGITPLYARELVEDLEIQRASGDASESIDEGITELGLQFQIATRLTSWVAVSKEQTVDPRAPGRKEQMPHELPYGMSVQKLGLRPAAARRSKSRRINLSERKLAPREPAVYAAAPPAPAQGGAPAGPPPPQTPAPAAPPPALGFGKGGSTRAGGLASEGELEAGEFEDDEFEEDDGESLLEAQSESADLGAADFDAPLRRSSAPIPGAPRKRARSVEKKKSGGVRGVFDRIRNIFGSKGLRGTVVVSEDARLVITLVAPDALRWEPVHVVIDLEDGTALTVELIVELTTYATDATKGQVLRLAMRWSGGPLSAPPRRIRVSGPAAELTIVL